MIDQYASGRYMQIGDKKYSNDLKIINGHVKSDWWRKEGHRLDREDIADILDARPEELVVGTGYAQNMRIPDATRRFLSEHGIRLTADETSGAVAAFNRKVQQGRKVAGAFHLTC